VIALTSLRGAAQAASDWPAQADLASVATELGRRPPLVAAADCRSLRDRLTEVAAGRGFLVQAGDCAELFDEVSAHTTTRKAAQLAELADLVEARSGLPAVSVGRIAGQFAKPRSHQTETGPGDLELPVYRGDAVNGAAATPAARRPDPRRMLTAYDKSAVVLGHLAGSYPTVYASHEALLLPYETALLRTDAATGSRYGSSAHLLWVGERTRQPDGPWVELLAEVANPVAVKLGPTATPADVTALLRRLNPAGEPGRLVFIARIGADRVADVLPDLVAAAGTAQPVWICDPMHGNTVRHPDGRKTRALADILADVSGFVRVLRGAGGHPGGIHLETSPDDVTECVGSRADIAGASLPRYWTGCDPRLNPGQARAVVAAFVEALDSCSG